MIQLQHAPPFHLAPDLASQAAAARLVPHDPADLVEACLQRTSEALGATRSATPGDLAQAIEHVREAQAQDSPLDLLEALAKVQGHQEEHLSGVIRVLGDRLAASLNPSPPLIPFAGKLIAPSAFYDSFELLHRAARTLLSPVIFAEDTDAIGTASANPIAAVILAEEIRSTVFKRFGIRPFVTVARLDYENWTFLSRKHFEL